MDISDQGVPVREHRERVAFTDDEVLALAVIKGRPWPAPLTTVDLEDPGDVARAVSRGRRSLVVRQFVIESEDGIAWAPSLEELVDDVVARDPEVVLVVVDGELQAAVGAPWISVISSPVADRSLEVTSTNDGVQMIERTHNSETRALVAGAVVEAVRDGVTDVAVGAQFLSVTRVLPEGVRVLLARRGEAGIQNVDGKIMAGEFATVGDLMEAFWA